MQSQMNIRCSNCGQPFAAQVRNYIDVANEPRSKEQLLSGQLNTEPCPNCGTVNTMVVPILYHDPSKEMLIAYVPQELNLNKDEQERIVGDLLNILPKENFKGYMFNPRRALTMQGMVETILEADGVTPEMMQQQRDRLQMAQDMVDASQEQLLTMIRENDEKIDLNFVQLMSIMAQRMAEAGRGDVAQRIAMVQNIIMEHSTFGQEVQQQQAAQESVVEEVALEIRALGQQANRADFLKLARKYADDDDRLQALVGLIRPAFDYEFFQELTTEIGKAPAAEREDLESLRDKLVHYTSVIDQQSQMQVQNAAAMLQNMINLSPEQLDAAIRDGLPMIDDTFMAVLTTNIEEMTKRNNAEAASRLQQIYERVVTVLQENMQPELVFVNELLSTENDDAARSMIQNKAKGFGEPLLEVMDAVGEVLTAQGQSEIVDRLSDLRKYAVEAINA